jgi:hypothetical protein
MQKYRVPIVPRGVTDWDNRYPVSSRSFLFSFPNICPCCGNEYDPNGTGNTGLTLTGISHGGTSIHIDYDLCPKCSAHYRLERRHDEFATSGMFCIMCGFLGALLIIGATEYLVLGITTGIALVGGGIWLLKSSKKVLAKSVEARTPTCTAPASDQAVRLKPPGWHSPSEIIIFECLNRNFANVLAEDNGAEVTVLSDT